MGVFCGWATHPSFGCIEHSSCARNPLSRPQATGSATWLRGVSRLGGFRFVMTGYPDRYHPNFWDFPQKPSSDKGVPPWRAGKRLISIWFTAHGDSTNPFQAAPHRWGPNHQQGAREQPDGLDDLMALVVAMTPMSMAPMLKKASFASRGEYKFM